MKTWQLVVSIQPEFFVRIMGLRVMSEHEKRIYKVILEVFQERSPETEEASGDQLLVDQLGLRSLYLARMLAFLDVELGLDPFSELSSIIRLQRVEDMRAAYRLLAFDQPRTGPVQVCEGVISKTLLNIPVMIAA